MDEGIEGSMRSRNRKVYEAHGDVYFISSTVVGFVNLFRHEQPRQIFLDCLRFCIRRGDITLLAWVLMPNHFHLIGRRDPDKDISRVIASLKRYAARQIRELPARPALRRELVRIEQEGRHESGKGTAIWKPRFDSLVITAEKTLRQKIEYVHCNPVREGFVREPWQWPYSSAGAYAALGDNGVPVDTEWSCIGYGSIPSGRDS